VPDAVVQFYGEASRHRWLGRLPSCFGGMRGVLHREGGRVESQPAEAASRPVARRGGSAFCFEPRPHEGCPSAHRRRLYDTGGTCSQARKLAPGLLLAARAEGRLNQNRGRGRLERLPKRRRGDRRVGAISTHASADRAARPNSTLDLRRRRAKRGHRPISPR
jgi:hypothetical protein